MYRSITEVIYWRLRKLLLRWGLLHISPLLSMRRIIGICRGSLLYVDIKPIQDRTIKNADRYIFSRLYIFHGKQYNSGSSVISQQMGFLEKFHSKLEKLSGKNRVRIRIQRSECFLTAGQPLDFFGKIKRWNIILKLKIKKSRFFSVAMKKSLKNRFYDRVMENSYVTRTI